jgi:hypothetical protein
MRVFCAVGLLLAVLSPKINAQVQNWPIAAPQAGDIVPVNQPCVVKWTTTSKGPVKITLEVDADFVILLTCMSLHRSHARLHLDSDEFVRWIRQLLLADLRCESRRGYLQLHIRRQI